ncbi:MAG: HAD family hydrolase [Clostridiales bacterium]|nr:HAD family hydrolase [Clostridiales bacterium]
MIFDLDGTLLDTIGDLAEAVNFALENNGLSRLPLETIKSYVGNGAGVLIEKSSGSKQGEPLFEKCRKDFSAYYMSHLHVFTKPYEGVLDTLKELKNRGFNTAILSNKPDNAVKELSDFFFKGLIDTALGERGGVPKKPDPAAVLEIIEKLGVNKDEVIYVGDSEVDIQTGKNAGVKTLSCLWGFKTKEFLIENGSEILLERPNDLLKYI